MENYGRPTDGFRFFSTSYQVLWKDSDRVISFIFIQTHCASTTMMMVLEGLTLHTFLLLTGERTDSIVQEMVFWMAVVKFKINVMYADIESSSALRFSPLFSLAPTKIHTVIPTLSIDSSGWWMSQLFECPGSSYYFRLESHSLGLIQVF